MKKEEILNFKKDADARESVIMDEVAVKCKEIVAYQRQLFEELDATIRNLFPKDVHDLMVEYLAHVPDSYIEADTIKVYTRKEDGEVIILHRYDYSISWFKTHGNKIDKLVENPNDYTSLVHTAIKVEKYEKLLESLKAEIGSLYDKVCKWKTEQLNSMRNNLSQMNYAVTTQKPKAIRVTVLVEEI